jgi:hypothetical protein
MKRFILLFAGLISIIFTLMSQTISDIEGNVYNTVIVGNREWMKDNLKVTRYLNGDLIPNFTDIGTWSTLTSGARCYYANDSIANNTLYGALYNYYAAIDSRKLCPASWHVPTNDEWSSFFSSGGNESDFSVLTAGARVPEFMYLGTMSSWWSSTEENSTNAWAPWYGNGKFGRTNQDGGGAGKIAGFSIHCVRDVNSGVELNKEFSVQIYPDPTTDKVFINNGIGKYTKVQVFNMIGTNVIQKELNTGTNIIDVTALSKGIYIIKLYNNQGALLKKLIKD